MYTTAPSGNTLASETNYLGLGLRTGLTTLGIDFRLGAVAAHGYQQLSQT